MTAVILKTPLIGKYERQAMDLAEKAKAWFDEHPEDHSFSVGEVKPGELIGIRWAFDRANNNRTISVLVMRLPYDAVLVGDLDTLEPPK